MCPTTPSGTRRDVSSEQCWSARSSLLLSGRCHSSADPGPCAQGERLYEDIFGVGVCGCREGHEVWPDTGECHQVGGRGPCHQGETFGYDPHTGLTRCTESQAVRVFDVIPAGETHS